MITKNLEQWLAEEVELTFDIERLRPEKHQILQDWLTHERLDTDLIPNVKRLQDLLVDNVDAWNEDELKIMFIGPLLIEAEFNNYPHYKVFSQRKVRLKTEHVDSSGKIEWMVAKGRQIPRNPFFFLHEYKGEKGTGNDPLGQLLIAMVYAQHKNQNERRPLYGSYILGRLWFFVVLTGKEYSVSPAFDATKTEDLRQILANMQKVKEAIDTYLRI